MGRPRKLPDIHGTHLKYCLDKCRCDLCKAGHAAYMRKHDFKYKMSQQSTNLFNTLVKLLTRKELIAFRTHLGRHLRK